MQTGSSPAVPGGSPRPLLLLSAPCRAVVGVALFGLLTLVGATANASPPGASVRYLDRDGRLLPFASEEEVLHFLREANVVGVRELSSGSTRPLRLDLELDGVRARAVFRSVDRRRERLRMRDGSAYAVFYDRAESEVAAYRLSRLLGLAMVPPTVLREYDGRHGSLQLWVERARTEQQRREAGDLAPEPIEWMQQRAIMRVFDALVANADRNTGNSLVDDRWQLWMIDHTRAFQRPRGDLDLDEVNHVPEELLGRLRGIGRDDLERALAGALETPQLEAVADRLVALLAHVDRLIVERGRGAVVLPGPMPRAAESSAPAGPEDRGTVRPLAP